MVLFSGPFAGCNGVWVYFRQTGPPKIFQKVECLLCILILGMLPARKVPMPLILIKNEEILSSNGAKGCVVLILKVSNASKILT